MAQRMKKRRCPACDRESFSDNEPIAVHQLITRSRCQGLMIGASLGIGVALWINVLTATAPAPIPDSPRHLDGRAVRFTANSQSNDDDEVRIDGEISGFADYLIRCGAYRPPVKLGMQVKPGAFEAEGETWYSHYLSEQRLTLVDRDDLSDPDFIDKEYGHLVMQSSCPMFWSDSVDVCPEAGDLEDAIVCYLPCSYHNHSYFGRTAIDAGLSGFDGTEYANNAVWKSGSDSASMGPVWGGAFWELRQQMGRDPGGESPMDRLLLRAWPMLGEKDVADSPSVRAAFSRALLVQDLELYGGKHISLITSVLRRRGLAVASPATP